MNTKLHCPIAGCGSLLKPKQVLIAYVQGDLAESDAIKLVKDILFNNSSE